DRERVAREELNALEMPHPWRGPLAMVFRISRSSVPCRRSDGFGTPHLDYRQSYLDYRQSPTPGLFVDPTREGERGWLTRQHDRGGRSCCRWRCDRAARLILVVLDLESGDQEEGSAVSGFVDGSMLQVDERGLA